MEIKRMRLIDKKITQGDRDRIDGRETHMETGMERERERQREAGTGRRVDRQTSVKIEMESEAEVKKKWVKQKANKHDLTTLLFCVPGVKRNMYTHTHACIEASMVDITHNLHHRNDHALLEGGRTLAAHNLHAEHMQCIVQATRHAM